MLLGTARGAMKFKPRGGGGGGGGRRIFKMPKIQTPVKSHLVDFGLGMAQDQAEYWSGYKLSTGAPTKGGVAGDAVSKFFRKLMGWVPEEIHTRDQAVEFIMVNGIEKEQAVAAVDGRYTDFNAKSIGIFQNKLDLDPNFVLEFKIDVKYIVTDLIAANANSRQSRLTE